MSAGASNLALKPAPGTAPRPGRPPSISTQAIIAAALEIGLDKVSFRRLAERLGVNVATIYRYVRNRNELLRLAAFQLTLNRRLPDEAHAHWSQLAVRYAEEMFESFMNEPELVAELLKGSLGPHVEMDVLDQFIGAMARYGFRAEEALALHQALGTMAIGAAVGRHAGNLPRKPVFLAAFLVLPVRALLYLGVSDPRALIALQLLDGIGAGVFAVMQTLVISDLTRGSGHFNLGLGILATALGSGAALSNLLAGLVVRHAGYAEGFATLAAIAVMALGLFWTAMPETRGGGGRDLLAGLRRPA